MSELAIPQNEQELDFRPIRFSKEIDQIATALAAAQGEFTPVLKNKYNKHFGSWYADLASVIDATRPALSKHGIAFVQFPFYANSRVTVVSRLIHKSGQFMENQLSLKPEQDTAQKIASAVTYARRYTGESITGVSSEDDDDGNAASSGTSQQDPLKDQAKFNNNTIQKQPLPPAPQGEKVFLEIEFHDLKGRTDAKALGAKWDGIQKSWWVSSNNTEAIKRWGKKPSDEVHQDDAIQIDIDDEPTLADRDLHHGIPMSDIF